MASLKIPVIYSCSHSNGNEHKCTMLAWNKIWNRTVSIQWQRSNNPSWSAEENLHYCHKAFWKKVRACFIWKKWAVWNNNLTMWTDTVSPSWKYFCRNGINLLPHTHWHQQGFSWSHAVTLAAAVHRSHQTELKTTSGREASPTETFPDHLPNLFQQSLVTFSSWHTLSEASKPDLVH